MSVTEVAFRFFVFVLVFFKKKIFRLLDDLFSNFFDSLLVVVSYDVEITQLSVS